LLKDRKDDIPALVDGFLDELSADHGMPRPEVSADGMKALQELEWTGNVRELHNVIERLIILCDNKITEQDVLDFGVPHRRAKGPQMAFDRYDKFQDFKDYAEKEFIQSKLDKNSWNITKTAEMMDIQRSHLYNKMEKYGIKRDE
jgi:DNA-binding NtrC family response regulator